MLGNGLILQYFLQTPAFFEGFEPLIQLFAKIRRVLMLFAKGGINIALFPVKSALDFMAARNGGKRIFVPMSGQASG
ncbi:hypothetical protein [Terasakiella pusilla]|uniref:hypothetical protein n=1 Tax=Terasakiella pusilla TaxID=64973 RepID=UPI003AA9603B